MKARILAVEDDPDFLEDVRSVLKELSDHIELEVAKARASACEALDGQFFDLVIVDLRIPPLDGGLDADPRHGHAVFQHARKVAPGTPVLVLTGSPAEDFFPSMLHQAQKIDVWSQGEKVSTVQFLQKAKFDQCAAMLKPMITAIEALEDVELDSGDVVMTVPQQRLVRIFAKRFRGAHCKVDRLGGGLSGAIVLRLVITDATGARVQQAVAKIGSLGDVYDEAERFDSFVARLDPDSTPRRLATIECGAGALAGVFYGLADRFASNAFAAAIQGDGGAARAVAGVEAACRKWNDGVGQTRRTIGDVRRRVLRDETFSELVVKFALPWARAFEANAIQTRWVCIHGDMHGQNVLLSSDHSVATLIDYGDVGEGPAALDPITLELSLLFHPAAPDLAGWPTHSQAEHWSSVEDFVRGSPVADHVRACRAWALRAAAGKREIAACAYAYLVRQLKYPQTDADLVHALLTGVRDLYDRT